MLVTPSFPVIMEPAFLPLLALSFFSISKPEICILYCS